MVCLIILSMWCGVSSRVFKKVIIGYLELVSITVMKYLWPFVEGVGNGPQMSMPSALPVL